MSSIDAAIISKLTFIWSEHEDSSPLTVTKPITKH